MKADNRGIGEGTKTYIGLSIDYNVQQLRREVGLRYKGERATKWSSTRVTSEMSFIVHMLSGTFLTS
ncbi:MAG: hypothetical protein Q8838_02715 [Candidatus Phytoplasma australasiaticum]|nr:hypothetical protein [Candidatus Phytoplasma australasiaticum]